MSKLSKEQIQELSMNILKDSKRRTVYYNSIEKEGYMLTESDRKWVLFYHMRFVLAILAPMILNNFYPKLFLLWIGLGLLLYLLIGYLFTTLFQNKKVPLKVAEKDLNQLYQPEVLKNHRTLERYYSSLAGILLVYVMTLVLPETMEFPLWMQIAAIGLVGLVFVWRLMILSSVSNQYKIATQKFKEKNN